MKKLLLISTTILLGFNNLIAQDAWLNNVMGGFNNTNNTQSYGLNIFNNQLYTATGADSGYVYRTANGQRNSWEKVFYQPGVTSVNTINSTSGNMYVSGYFGYNAFADTYPDSTIIYRSTDGSTNWTPYFHFSGSANFIVPFKGLGTIDSIYIVKSGANGSEIWKNDQLNTSNSWTQTNFVNNGSYTITSTCIHNNKLYVGTNQGSTGTTPTIWSSPDGNNWVQEVTSAIDTTQSQSISSIASFGGYLYVGTNNYNGSQIWKTNDFITWSLVGQYPNLPKVSNLQVISGQLCASMEAQFMGGATIIRNVSAQPYTYSMNTGFGIHGLVGSNGSTIQFNNNIFYACSFMFNGYSNQSAGQTMQANGSQIWKLCLGTVPTVNLGQDITVCAGVTHTFNAGSGAAGYVWCDGSTNQTLDASYPQDYIVTVMGANGCEGTDTVALKNIPSPTIFGNFYELLPLCKGDSRPINVSANSNLRDTLPTKNRVLVNGLSIYPSQSTYDTLHVSGIAHDDWTPNTFVSVTIDSLYYGNNPDLTLSLIAPDNTAITLAQNGNGSNYIGTTFTTNATNQIYYSGNGPNTGLYIPITPFSYLNSPTNGAWLLQITNNSAVGGSGTLKGWSLKFTQPDTNVTFSWSPAAGLSTTNTNNVIASPTVSTVYTVTATNGVNACSSKDSLRIEVPGIKINSHAAHICYGYSDSLSATIIGLSNFGQTNLLGYHWSNNAGLTDTVAFGITVTPTSTTTYYAMDTIYNCPLRDTTIVNVSPQLSVSTSSNPTTICQGDNTTLTAVVNGGVPTYTFLWTDNTNTYTTAVTTVTPLITTTFTLTATDAFGCTISSNTNVAVTPSKDIYGHIDSAGVSSTKIINGKVVIYKYLSYQIHFDTVQVVSLNANGDYHFTNINHGSYLIKVFADTSIYHKAIPTYFGNKFLWTTATIVNHNCNKSDTSNISVLFPQVIPAGPGALGGLIREGYGFSRQEGDPIPGLDVKLGKNPGGATNIVASTQTNGSGYYSFDGLALNSVVGGSYTVYADVPGLGRDSSYTVVLDPTHPSYDSLNYKADSTKIYIVPTSSTGINNLVGDATTHFTIYPNPFKGTTSIEYNISTEADVTLEVYNVLGIKIKSLVNSKQSVGNHKCNLNNQSNNPLSSGIYFITLTIDGKSSTQRIVVME